MVPAIRKKNGKVQIAQGAGFLRMWTVSLMSMKMVAAKRAEMSGAIPRPANMAPRSLAAIPAPFDLGSTSYSDANASDS